VELEAVLDVDMEMAMNPQAKRIIVYQDGTDSFPVALAPTRKRDFVWRTLSYIIPPSRIAGSRPNAIYEFVVLSISAGGQAYSAPIFVKTLN
jgi:hypothetical protein